MVIYVLKVLAGLAALLGVVWLAIDPGVPAAWAVGGGLVVMLGFVPLAATVYARRDELNRRLHEQASAAGLVLAVVACGVAGVLQARGLAPLFNQFWGMAVLVGVWGVALVWRDRRYR